jgi:flagellar biosynthetic protein FliQ
LTPESAIQLIRDALTTALMLAAPLLLVGFVVGIAMSLVQIVTSIQDSAFNTVPRLAAFLGAFFLALPWMLHKMTAYAVSVFGDVTRYAR